MGGNGNEQREQPYLEQYSRAKQYRHADHQYEENGDNAILVSNPLCGDFRYVRAGHARDGPDDLDDHIPVMAHHKDMWNQRSERGQGIIAVVEELSIFRGSEQPVMLKVTSLIIGKRDQ